MIFLLGSLYSIVLIALGGYVGYKIGRNELSFLIKSVEDKMKATPPKPQLGSGPVIPISARDLEAEKSKPVADIQRSVTQNIGDLPEVGANDLR